MFVSYFKPFGIRLLIVILFGQLSYKITTLASYNSLDDFASSCYLSLTRFDNIGTEDHFLEKSLLTAVIYGDFKKYRETLRGWS